MPSTPAMLRGTLTWDQHDQLLCAHPEHPWVPPVDETLPPGSEPELIYPTDLHYQGCFRLPAYPVRYDFPPRGGGYHARNDSLFLTGFADYHGLGEISIPTPILGATTLAELNRAVEIQPIQDPTEGSWQSLAYGAAINLGGCHVHHERLITTVYRHYDADGNQPFSHWARSLNLAPTGEYVGPVQLLVTDATETPHVHAGNVSGYMGAIAPEWQAAFRGVCFTGNAGIPIVSRTSLGPCVFAFDPDDLGRITPVPTTPLVFYPGSHPTLGNYTIAAGEPNPNVLFNGTMQVCGVCQPVGTRSVLFFGVIGIGNYSYGMGTPDQALDGQEVPGEPGVIYCWDPVNPTKGDHAYPYDARVWAYDAAELALVAAGSKQPWEVVPYAAWTLPSDFYSWLPRLSATGYDPDGQRIFVAQTRGDGDAPLIHVYGCGPAAARAARARTSRARREAAQRVRLRRG
jgi:hypothetical protein